MEPPMHPHRSVPIAKIAFCTCLLAALTALAQSSEPPPPRASTMVVNSTDDLVDAAPGDGACITVARTCTLRAAIMEANASRGLDVVFVPSGIYSVTLAGDEPTSVHPETAS